MAELDPLFLDGLTNNVSGQGLRLYPSLQAGVFAPGDLKITAGPGTREILAAAGLGFVAGNNAGVLWQGLYACRNDASKSSTTFEAGGIPAPDATNPRVDSVVARVWDQAADGSGLRKWRLTIVQGTAAAGTQITNSTNANYRQGAPGGPGGPALPANCLILADLVTRPAMTTYPAADIVDRRPWAQGAGRRIFLNGGTQTKGDATFAAIAAGLQSRLECSGRPVEMLLRARGNFNSASVGRVFPMLDGLQQTGWEYVFNTNGDFAITVGATVIPSPGTHLFNWGWLLNSGGTFTMYGTGTPGIEVVYREVLPVNADNT